MQRRWGFACVCRELGPRLFDPTFANKNLFCCIQAFFDQDIVINFPEHGMHLRFEPRSQRLRLVEVYDVSRLQVSPAFQQHVLTLPEG